MIQKSLIKLSFVIAVATIATLLLADNSFASTDPCNVKTNILPSNCGSTGDPVEDNPVWGILLMVITIMTSGVGLLAIGGFVYGAILYTSARENAAQVTKAKETISNVVIGLVLYALMWAILQFLIPGGVFTDGSGGPSSSTAPSPSVAARRPATPQPKPPAKLSVGSWNTYKYNNQDTVASSIESLLESDMDAIGIQEASFHTKSLTKLACTSCAYGMYPRSGAAKKIAILWNKDVMTPTAQGVIYGSTQDGVKKYFVWVKFKHNDSDRSFYMVNTHFPYDAEKDGKLKNTAGGKAYVKHMANLVSTTESFQNQNIPIFLTGDFNADYRRDNCSVATFSCKSLSRNLKVKSGWEYTNLAGIGSSTGTAGSSRIIDYVFSWDLNFVTYESMNIARGGSSRNGWNGSDHKPIVLSATIADSDEQ